MDNEKYNVDFFGYTGTINRKNYVINMTILIMAGIIASFIKPDAFLVFSAAKFLVPVLSFLISMFIFVVIFSCLSLVYRRFADISSKKSERFKGNMNKLFVILYVCPALYLIAIKFFVDSIPGITPVLDLITMLVFIPLAVLTSFIISFIKA